MRLRYLLSGTLSVAALLAAGCSHCCKNPRADQPPSNWPPPSSAPPPGSYIPPQGNTYIPPQGNFPPPSAGRGDLLLPAPLPPAGSQAPPGPSRYGQEYGTAPMTMLPPDQSLRLGAPVWQAPAAAIPPTQSAPPPLAEPERKADPSPLPAGIPGFTKVSERITYGLRPFPSGYEWLRERGYRAVLSVHAAEATVFAERTQTERQGLTFLSLAVSPQSFNDRLLSDFARLVNEPGYQPLFITEAEAGRVGVLWYVYLRTRENLADETARAEAQKLGLRDDGRSELWLAAQHYLAGLNRMNPARP